MILNPVISSGGGGSVETVTGSIIGNSRRPVTVVYFDGTDSYINTVTSSASIECVKNSFIYASGGQTTGDVEMLQGGIYKVYGDFSVIYGTN